MHHLLLAKSVPLGAVQVARVSFMRIALHNYHTFGNKVDVN